MNDPMRQILESKRQKRKELAALPFSEKIAIVEKLRDRSLLIASSPLRRRFPREEMAGWIAEDEAEMRRIRGETP